MNTFEDYEIEAAKVPLSLRNNRDRIDMPVMGLQQEAGKIGSLLAAGYATGKFDLTEKQKAEVNDRLADVLWYMTILCKETGIPLRDVAAHSVKLLQDRAKDFDAEQR